MNDPQLFDPSRTTTAQCTACGATRLVDETRAPACSHDRDTKAGIHHHKRPVACLNRTDNRHEGIPY